MIYKLKKRNIKVSLFVEPDISDIKISKDLGANCIEIHTGKYCNLIGNKERAKSEFSKIKKAALFAKKNLLEVHAGHGLTYTSVRQISRISYISEFNIGHFIIAESIFIGLQRVIKKFRKIINK